MTKTFSDFDFVVNFWIFVCVCVFFTNFKKILVWSKIDNNPGGSIGPLGMFCNTVVWSPLPLGSFCSIMEAYYVTVLLGLFEIQPSPLHLSSF